MGTRELAFDIFAVDRASKVFSHVGTKAETMGTKITKVMSGIGSATILAAGAVGVASIKLAGDFQESTTQLVTGAGESEKSLEMIRKGLLDMAPAVGMGPVALSKAMFLVESAGYHGAAGLAVMKAAAEGAKVGGAEATVVANGLTTAMTDYHIPVARAADITSKLVATVAAGKTNMADLSASLSSVLPTAAAAHIGLSQVLGAMGTMTAQGISADQSAQNLANTIRSLSNPSSVASHAMAQMGLNSVKVAKNLGRKGLTGTLSEMTTAILKHMGPAGLVLQSSFNESTLAAKSAITMMKELPPHLQTLAKRYLDGTITQKNWTKALKNQPALVASMGKQFATVAKQAAGFSDSLKSGEGSAKTYNALLADMTGGATGLNTSLALTGPNMATFKTNTANIGKAASDAGGHVKGWAETQKDFNVKMAQMWAGIQKVGVELGTKLIPRVMQVVDWSQKHSDVVQKLVVGLGAFLAICVAVTIATKAWAVATGIIKVATAAWTGVQWLLNAAMTANPIGLVVVAVGLLIGAIALVATKTTWFQTAWEYMTGAVGKAWQYLWNVIIAPIFRFIMDGIGSLLGGISNMLDALSNVPGFGWAKDAAKKMRDAATQAHALANGIKDIPDHKNVTVAMNLTGGHPMAQGPGGSGGQVANDAGVAPVALPRPGSAAAKGGTTINVQKVVAHNYTDFVDQMSAKSRLAALGMHG